MSAPPSAPSVLGAGGSPPMRWTPVRGNCNDAWQVGADPVEYVRCTAIEQHEGLHRCHFQPPGVPDAPRTALIMWGDDDAAVSIDVLRDVLNPLGLVPNVTVRTIPLGPEAGGR